MSDITKSGSVLTGKLKNKTIAYCDDDIERIFSERVEFIHRPAEIKSGVVCEWVFKYPNGACFADVVCSIPISSENFSFAIGAERCERKIKTELYKICAMYSTAIGEKL